MLDLQAPEKEMPRGKPTCAVCNSLRLDCGGYGPRPRWMDGGAKEKEKLARIRETVKDVSRQKKRAAMNSKRRHRHAEPTFLLRTCSRLIRHQPQRASPYESVPARNPYSSMDHRQALERRIPLPTSPNISPSYSCTTWTTRFHANFDSTNLHWKTEDEAGFFPCCC
jgi:hypothetical protein